MSVTSITAVLRQHLGLFPPQTINGSQQTAGEALPYRKPIDIPTHIEQTPYPGQEVRINEMIARQISTAREHFGSDADLPVDVAMEKMRAMNNSLLKVFERLLSKGYTPGKDESAIDFYARAMKIEMGKTRVPGA